VNELGDKHPLFAVWNALLNGIDVDDGRRDIAAVRIVIVGLIFFVKWKYVGERVDGFGNILLLFWSERAGIASLNQLGSLGLANPL
jgi:hypothetical protein